MKPKTTYVLLAVLAAALLVAAATENDTVKKLTTVAPITPDEFLENIKYLASDEMQGRVAGSKGLTNAANAIRENFRSIGLKPLGDDYFQALDVQVGSTFGPNNSFIVNINEFDKAARMQQEYVPVSRGRENVEDLPVVFVGYGISAPDVGYDDYTGIDVKGKVVLMLDYEPQRNQRDSAFDGTADTQHGQTQNKVITARTKGAAGVIIVPGPVGTDEGDRTLPEMGTGYVVNPMGLPAVRVSYESFKPVLAAFEIDLVAEQKAIDADFKPRSRNIESATATLKIDVAPKMNTVHNVVALLPGSDPKLKEQYIVVGAHYDHLGPGYFGTMTPGRIGEVHNGADDNASGTSGLLEVAEALALADEKPKRSIIFMAFAAEEMGLLGSAYYVNNPLMPKDATVAMLNMDMIGRVDEKRLTVGGIGTAEMFGKLVEESSKSYDLKLSLQKGGFASSDNASFTAAKIPALFFFSGTHSQYHTPDDDWKLINAVDGAKVAQLVADLTRAVADADETPTFIDGSATMRPSNRRAGNRPWFGSMPDFGYQGEGYKFSAVTEGSPAGKAGLKGGDILIGLAGKPVGNIYDFTAILGAYKPGDVIIAKVLRDGKEMEMEVTLTRRK